MTIEKDKFIIEYDEENDYILELVNYLEINTKKIMDFFELSNLQEKKKIVIWNDLELYKKHIEQFFEYHDYMCADTNDGNINILSLEEAHKTKEHDDMTFDDLKDIICHEFVHICQQECEIAPLKEDIVWFWEALSTNLGNPSQFHEIKIPESNLNDFNNLKDNYLIAYTMGKYMLENYSHDDILRYVKYPKLLLNDNDKIIQGAINWTNEKNYQI